ncbi:Cyclopropane-fatty-acyl-phospholipid synthase-like protein [Leptotrombidium deliense]|uniref:Cyclopropane-fatty-acyl-phospholipid synthase-like protein n=1 Tax=Leptotrombidium deliense TaxID=299467 RepID=A0A443RXC0_9ACAR|nr:Cyclopropane-fatty-acyl-phospholipid synthase-like protein [Leptotrombidium deliense]
MDVLKSIEDVFVIEDVKNLRADFAKTVSHWIQKTDKNWEKLVNHYGLKMTRGIKGVNSNMFGMAEEGYMQIYQFVLSKNGLITGYQTTV